MQAVLMVAGKSTRTFPLTLTRPKPLLPIMNRSLIQHSLDQLVGLFDEIILITGYRKEMIEAKLGDKYKGMRIVYQEQREQLGTGHAVLQAKPYITDKFVAMNGDDIFARVDLETILTYEYAALVKQVQNPALYGVYQVDEQNRVLNLVEKPKIFMSDLANIGCYVLQPDFFDELENTAPSERGEIEITSAVHTMAQKRDVYVVPIRGFWLPTGFSWDLLNHQEYLMQDLSSFNKGMIEQGVVLKGAVAVGENTLIKSGVYVEGPVIIGDNCEIGPNCYLRSYTSIGDHCKIGQSVEIKNSIIMPNCYIQHLSYIGDSIIGEGSMLGAGTITANRRHDGESPQSKIKGILVNTRRAKLGAIVGDGVQTGVHTAIYPGRKIWPMMQTSPGSLVIDDIIPQNFAW